MSVVLQSVGHELSARLGPRCDSEGGELRKKPLHANSQAGLTELAMKAYSVLAQPQRHSGEMDTVVVR
jgi:hypothetical protein